MDTRTEPEFTTLREDPASRWLAWLRWSCAALLLAAIAVLGFGADPGLLLGWACGSMIAAVLLVVRRR